MRGKVRRSVGGLRAQRSKRSVESLALRRHVRAGGNGVGDTSACRANIVRCCDVGSSREAARDRSASRRGGVGRDRSGMRMGRKVGGSIGGLGAKRCKGRVQRFTLRSRGDRVSSTSASGPD